eukprot:CAMPEP_0175077938 /NCGR_PEP_ID=MMETSP0052_2-20121109/23752_1 /TAXON_ID=51329 ORGANISM="Polytomella parva, Strain SAG 63-3" /NCGR_SAMPLE_ID=MMETSP0052_2 /ASSEMBLY_ACC=CAM_ASM_000194 /LENGTH=311 /DNA_ID=CAMNT_0016347627 /DNA_START=109 /DNA_END=1042 /DNA_ORIENTATION=+
MASTIRFRPKAEVNWSEIKFDGGQITVAELRRLIAEKKGYTPEVAGDLQLTNASTKEVLRHDTQTVLKNSNILIQRVAPQKFEQAGDTSSSSVAPSSLLASNAGFGLSGTGMVAPGTSSFVPALRSDLDGVGDDHPTKPGAHHEQEEIDTVNFLKQISKSVDIECQMAAQQTQPSYRGGGRGPGSWQAINRGGRGGPPPPDYRCPRCGQLGHYVSHCPTQGDPTYDKKVRATTGVPMSRMVRNPDGSVYLPDGNRGELAMNRSGFQELQALQGISSAAGNSTEISLALTGASANSMGLLKADADGDGEEIS